MSKSSVIHEHRLTKSEAGLLKLRHTGRDRYSRLMRRLQRQAWPAGLVRPGAIVYVTRRDVQDMIHLLVTYGHRV